MTSATRGQRCRVQSSSWAPTMIESDPSGTGIEHEPGTREALVKEIDDFSSDLRKWQDRDYYAHKRSPGLPRASVARTGLITTRTTATS